MVDYDTLNFSHQRGRQYNMGINKKRRQLGMNPSTASGRLVKDLLFSFVLRLNYKCYRCGEDLTRETFSIEHKVPWLDSKDPIGLYFDLGNIAFSHNTCNSGAARKPHAKYFNNDERRLEFNRRKRIKWATLSKEDQRQIRRDKYLRYGK